MVFDGFLVEGSRLKDGACRQVPFRIGRKEDADCAMDGVENGEGAGGVSGGELSENALWQKWPVARQKPRLRPSANFADSVGILDMVLESFFKVTGKKFFRNTSFALCFV